MQVITSNSNRELGTAAGKAAAALIRKTIQEKGGANIILATGTSQFETLRQLISEEGIAWEKVTMFHLDEYIGLPVTHPASFRKYLQERFLAKVPVLKAVVLINGEVPPPDEINRIGDLIRRHPIDVALVGIGENGHLAFNDPPADFDTTAPYIVVNLDGACRRQQMNEGWFATVDDVPAQAISMSVHQIMQSAHIICSVPGARKAQAVKDSLERPVSNLYPASILQQHPDCVFYLDEESAALLDQPVKTK
ncbi:glucosamine-6-phosphate deaminase [Chitinophaga lutea]|uniref:Glucosamine-6-phosphate deaminase n=1 Tax=Chitinophaga lutea TaxID=2488634 RepID=A0A3N4PZR1_9BACT|nr:glucosamine-6-phosphate deaminase [Chitinophaga lutea]RPE14242.1 glucosamine-6-phosphate deaminase [Chitinophaga lutea]